MSEYQYQAYPDYENPSEGNECEEAPYQEPYEEPDNEEPSQLGQYPGLYGWEGIRRSSPFLTG